MELFHSHFHRLVRYLDRLSGDPELASDLAQVAFVKLHRRGALPDRLAERDRQMLLLRADGYAYRELAAALGLNESSVGTLLARAKRAFREAYEGGANAPR